MNPSPSLTQAQAVKQAASQQTEQEQATLDGGLVAFSQSRGHRAKFEGGDKPVTGAAGGSKNVAGHSHSVLRHIVFRQLCSMILLIIAYGSSICI